MLRVRGRYEVKGDVRGPADILMWKASIGALVMATHDSLAHETHATHHKHREDDADDRPDGAGVPREIVGGREICTDMLDEVK